MKRATLIALFTVVGFSSCSSMQNPFTMGSANYQILKTICELETANTQQVKLACSALGLATPAAAAPEPAPSPAK